MSHAIKSFRARRLALVPALLATALFLGGCQNQSASIDPMTTGSTDKPSLKETAAVGEKWKKDPANTELGLSYASRLKQIGQTDQQLEVLAQLSSSHPKDGNIQSIYGKELLMAGRVPESSAALEQAAALPQADWKTFSALGSAYDQLGRYADARNQYQRALQMQPNEMSVLNNMGMSMRSKAISPRRNRRSARPINCPAAVPSRGSARTSRSSSASRDGSRSRRRSPARICRRSRWRRISPICSTCSRNRIPGRSSSPEPSISSKKKGRLNTGPYAFED